MFHQVGLTVEGLGTSETLVLTLARVYADVTQQVRLLAEALAAQITLEWPFSCVQH